MNENHSYVPYMNKERIVFVVGSSRSGTTMMGRILGKSPLIHTFEELHFFDELLVSKVEESTHVDLMAALMCRERDGYHRARNTDAYKTEAAHLVSNVNQSGEGQENTYAGFLFAETEANNASIPCEQTPRYVFHINHIFESFPEARVICMVRDPRDVAISQKFRWRVRGDTARWTPRASLQSWANYHPWITAKLWKASMTAALSAIEDPRVCVLKFEDLLDDPDKHVKQVAQFIGVEYIDEMLAVESVISSFGNADVRGIDSSRKGNWTQKGLKDKEVAILEAVCTEEMEHLGYSNTLENTMLLQVLGYATLPFKLICASLMNFGRFKSGFKPLVRRLLA